jgi:hypothetical protein
MVKKLKENERGLYSTASADAGSVRVGMLGKQSGSAGGKRQYEIDYECSQFNVALTTCRDVVYELAERLAPFLSEEQEDGEGKCDPKLSCPLAIEIQGWRHRAEAINSTVRDILRRLEVDQRASPKDK